MKRKSGTKRKTRLTETWPFLSPGPLSLQLHGLIDLGDTGNEIGLKLTFSDWFVPCICCVSVFCFVRVITLLSFYCHLFYRWLSCLFLYFLLHFYLPFYFVDKVNKFKKQLEEEEMASRNIRKLPGY